MMVCILNFYPNSAFPLKDLNAREKVTITTLPIAFGQSTDFINKREFLCCLREKSVTCHDS